MFSQTVLLALVSGGLSRDAAYRIVQRDARAAWTEGRRSARCWMRTPRSRCRAEALDGAFDLLPPCAISTDSPMPWRSSPRDPVSSAGRPAGPVQSGKVRELYDAGEGRLLMVASDRISAFDVIMAEPIPDKGRVLTAMTAYWLEELADLAPNHLISADAADFPEGAAALPGGLDYLAGRSMLVHRAEMLDIECIVRGYLAGSAFKEYQREGTVHGMAMPAGLRHADRLPEPIFTPSTKATEGHDLNIGMAEAIDLVGKEAAEAAPSLCLAAYRRAAARAEEQGIVICDTKFELGYIDGDPVHLRRGADAGLLAVLAGRRLRAGDQPTVLRQAAVCATGSRASPGTSSAAPAAARGDRGRHLAPVRRRLRAGLRPPLADWYGAAHGFDREVLGTGRGQPAGGHRRPEGATIERALPALGLDGVSRGAGGQGLPVRHRCRRRGRRAGPGHGGGRAGAGQPGHRGVVGHRPAGRRRGGTGPDGGAGRGGDVPGDQLRARCRPGRATGSGPRPSWCGTGTPRWRGYDALVLPGGFAHGDYLRPGAIARFSPVMEAVGRFAADGGPVVGICNGFQVLTEAGLLPGALQKNRGLRFLCTTVEVRVESPDSVLTSRRGRGHGARIPINHFEGNYICDADTLARLRDEDRVVLRYVDNPNGSVDDIAGICNAGAQRRRPHAPSRTGIGPPAGLASTDRPARALLGSAGRRPGHRGLSEPCGQPEVGGAGRHGQLRVRGILACWSTEALTPTVRHAE